MESSIAYSSFAGSAIADSSITEALITDSSIAVSSITESSITDSLIAVSSITDSSIADSSIAVSSIAESSIADSSIAESSIAESSIVESSIADSSILAPTKNPGARSAPRVAVRFAVLTSQDFCSSSSQRAPGSGIQVTPHSSHTVPPPRHDPGTLAAMRTRRLTWCFRFPRA